MIDWKTAIAQMVLIKQAIYDLDTEHLWEYRLPKLAAREEELKAVEAHLDEPLDPEYRSFLSYAGGWPAFYQTVDLFGPADLLDGRLFCHAMESLATIDELVLTSSHLRRKDLLPIAASLEDLDLFVITKRTCPSPGQVIWFAGGEIDRFPSFSDYYIAMLDYNRLEVQQLCAGKSTE